MEKSKWQKSSKQILSPMGKKSGLPFAKHRGPEELCRVRVKEIPIKAVQSYLLLSGGNKAINNKTIMDMHGVLTGRLFNANRRGTPVYLDEFDKWIQTQLQEMASPDNR